MATQIIELRKKINEVIDKEDKHLESDKEFAYASGQLIWYMLKHNQSETKTHSLLEVFISKNQVEDFKIVISQNIRKYFHAFKFFNTKGWFDKLASEVLAYEVEKETIKNLIPLIMAGYFSKNAILEQISEKAKKNKATKENNNE